MANSDFDVIRKTFNLIGIPYKKYENDTLLGEKSIVIYTSDNKNIIDFIFSYEGMFKFLS